MPGYTTFMFRWKGVVALIGLVRLGLMRLGLMALSPMGASQVLIGLVLIGGLSTVAAQTDSKTAGDPTIYYRKTAPKQASALWEEAF